MTDRSRRSPRGRAVLLGALAIFAAVQLIASVLLDYRWPQVRFPFFYLQLARLDSGRPPNVLVLGSSRTGHLVSDCEVGQVMRDLTGDPEVECFNACCLGGDCAVSARMLDQILAHGVRPRCVLIEVTPEQVCRRNGWLVNYHFGLLRWDDVPSYVTELARTHNLQKFIGLRCVPGYYYRDQIRKHVVQQLVDWYEDRHAHSASLESLALEGSGLGLRGVPGDRAKWQGRVAEGLRNSTSATNRTTGDELHAVRRWFIDYQVGGNAATALDRQLAQCRAHGIEPILYSPPLSSAARLPHPGNRGSFSGVHGRPDAQICLPLSRLPRPLSGCVLPRPPPLWPGVHDAL